MGLMKDLTKEAERVLELEQENRKLRRLLCNLYDGAAAIVQTLEKYEKEMDVMLHPDVVATLHEADRIASFMQRAIQKAFPNSDLTTRSLADGPNSVWVPLDVDKEG